VRLLFVRLRMYLYRRQRQRPRPSPSPPPPPPPPPPDVLSLFFLFVVHVKAGASARFKSPFYRLYKILSRRVCQLRKRRGRPRPLRRCQRHPHSFLVFWWSYLHECRVFPSLSDLCWSCVGVGSVLADTARSLLVVLKCRSLSGRSSMPVFRRSTWRASS